MRNVAHRFRTSLFTGIVGAIITLGPPATGLEWSDAAESLSDFPSVYSREGASFVPSFVFKGLIHYQAVAMQSSQGNEYGNEFRRLRLGAKGRIMDRFLLSASARFQPEVHDPYGGISTAYLAYSPYGNDKKSLEKFKIAVGKMKPRFTREYTTHSNKIKTLERSLLVNQLAPAKSTGLWIGGERGKASYVLAEFSGERTAEFSKLNSGTLVIGKFGFDLEEDLSIALDYMYATDEQQITTAVQHAFSLSAIYNEKYRRGPFALLVDTLYGKGANDIPDTYGVVILPSFRLSDSLELVARYQFARSIGSGGLQLQNRYESKAPNLENGERGDAYHAGYLGFNYYLFKAGVKLMGGVEYSHMGDSVVGNVFDGWTWFSGVRIFF